MELFYRLLKKDLTKIPLTRFIALSLGKSHYFSLKQANNDLGYKPKTLIKEAIKETCDYFKSRDKTT